MHSLYYFSHSSISKNLLEMPVGNPFISLVKSRFMSGLVFFKALWSNISTQKNGRWYL
jgi:hypothetical protein|tara:strand:- start:435 stop:608 length:174 start_codon:yes stop_codon:yes gene_type:complete